MVLHEDVQRKIHHEIDRMIGSERLPTLEDTAHMPYLQSTLCEFQRITGLTSYSGDRLEQSS